MSRTPETSISVQVGILEQSLNSSLEWRQVTLDRVPHHFHVDFVVAVDQSIAHTNNALPGDAGFTLEQVIRKVLHRFADDKELPKDRVLEKLRVLELLFTA